MNKTNRFEFGSRDIGDATPRPGDYIARLDRTGLRVLCEKGCTNGELATVVGSSRELVMSNGWLPNDGVWMLNEWARKRLAHDHKPRARRGQLRSSLNVETGKKDRTPHHYARPVHQFPIVAI